MDPSRKPSQVFVVIRFKRTVLGLPARTRPKQTRHFAFVSHGRQNLTDRKEDTGFGNTAYFRQWEVLRSNEKKIYVSRYIGTGQIIQGSSGCWSVPQANRTDP